MICPAEARSSASEPGRADRKLAIQRGRPLRRELGRRIGGSKHGLNPWQGRGLLHE
jgi:hypothetical protein